MKSRFLSLLALMGLFAFIAAAADVTGKWTADIPGRNGNTQNVTFDLKSDGSSVTGNMTTPRGEAPISDGKLDGNNISFNTVMKLQDNEVTMKYKGVVEGSTIKFTRTVNFNGNERTSEFTAKKQ